VLEKQTRYTDLKVEVEKLWTVKCVIVPIIVGALGSDWPTCYFSENNSKDCVVIICSPS